MNNKIIPIVICGAVVVGALAFLVPQGSKDPQTTDTSTETAQMDQTTGSPEGVAAVEPAAGTDAAATTSPAPEALMAAPAADAEAAGDTAAAETPAAAPADAAPAAENTACGDHAALVGQTVSSINVDTLKNEQVKDVRVMGETDAATMDFNPNRLNIIHDAQGVVTRVSCG